MGSIMLQSKRPYTKVNRLDGYRMWPCSTNHSSVKDWVVVYRSLMAVNLRCRSLTSFVSISFSILHIIKPGLTISHKSSRISIINNIVLLAISWNDNPAFSRTIIRPRSNSLSWHAVGTTIKHRFWISNNSWFVVKLWNKNVYKKKPSPFFSKFWSFTLISPIFHKKNQILTAPSEFCNSSLLVSKYW